MRRRRRLRIGALLATLPLLAFALAVALTPLPSELRGVPRGDSLRIEDRDGFLLREVRRGDGARARWVPLSDVGETLTHAVLAAEDARFFHHLGVDPLALLRAGAQAIVHGRFVSGASTLTMQLARTVRPHPKTLLGKLGEMALATRIELSLGKRAILEQYANRVSFGPNLRGVGAASEALFGKPPRALSNGEAALLAGMARGPSLYDLTKRPDLARRRRDRVLGRMVSDGWLVPAAAGRAKSEPVTALRRDASFGAPHFVDALARGALEQPGLTSALWSRATALRTTLDREVQRIAEREVTLKVGELRAKGVTAASALVVDNATGGVLAYVGSPDFFDPDHGGQNDGVTALRQPGSTLKPFLYELAMERLGWDPAAALPDIDMHIDVGAVHDYAPRDYDGHVRGPVLLRAALGNSLNVPAVWTAEQVGPGVFLDRLHDLGFASLHEDAEYYGPALALGDGEVTLLELAHAYVTLARRGSAIPLRFVTHVEEVGGGSRDLDSGEERRVMSPEEATLVIDILRDHRAREASFGEESALDFPFDVAAKTGTSKGFRDNWTVGFSSGVTVAVWVGNFGGEPMTNVSGITGAAPLFHAILEGVVARRGASSATPLPLGDDEHPGLVRVSVCALSGEPAGDACPHKVTEWRREGVDDHTCTMHEKVRIDVRNGLRAGPACADKDVVTRVVERFPEDLMAWAVAAGRPLAPEAWSPACPGGTDMVSTGEGVRIVYPLAGSRYVLDPDTPRSLQRLDVQIVPPPGVLDAALVVDGKEAGHSGRPFRVSWPLSPGSHDFVAIAGGVTSDPVRVTVRDGANGPLATGPNTFAPTRRAP